MNLNTLPLVSVCIANFNGEDLLADCLDSVRKQLGHFSLEIIVHDDASDDASLAVLKDYPEVTLITSDENVGFCAANNRMVARARGEFVLLLNNDAALFPDAIGTLLEEAKHADVEGIITLPQYDWQTGDIVDRGCLLDPFYTPVPNLSPRRQHVAYVIGACFWIRRSMWIALGGFPEWMGSIGEDIYLCCLARLRGYSVLVTSTSGYRHRQGASFGGNKVLDGRLSTTYRRRYLSERNRAITLLMFSPGWLRWPWWLAQLIVTLCESCVVSALSWSHRPAREVYYPAIKDAFVIWRTINASNQPLQSQGSRIGIRNYFSAFVLTPQKLRLMIRHGIPKFSN